MPGRNHSPTTISHAFCRLEECLDVLEGDEAKLAELLARKLTRRANTESKRGNAAELSKLALLWSLTAAIEDHVGYEAAKELVRNLVYDAELRRTVGPKKLPEGYIALTAEAMITRRLRSSRGRTDPWREAREKIDEAHVADVAKALSDLLRQAWEECLENRAADPTE